MNCPKHVEYYSKNKFEKLVHVFGFIILSFGVKWSVDSFKPKSVNARRGVYWIGGWVRTRADLQMNRICLCGESNTDSSAVRSARLSQSLRQIARVINTYQNVFHLHALHACRRSCRYRKVIQIQLVGFRTDVFRIYRIPFFRINWLNRYSHLEKNGLSTGRFFVLAVVSLAG